MFKRITIGLLIFAALSCISYAAAPVISYVEVTSLTDTSVIITWRTDVDSGTKLQYGITGLSNTFTRIGAGRKHHVVELRDLAPGTTYYYRAVATNLDGTSYGTEGTFTTLRTPAGTYLFTFATIADPQYAKGKADTYGPRGRLYSSSDAILNGLKIDINAKGPSFTVLKGDIAEIGYGNMVATAEVPIFDTLTGTSVPLWPSKKCFAIPGNHDKLNTYSGGNWVTKNLGLLVPDNGMPATLPNNNSDFNYSFNFNNCHFIFLDSVKSSVDPSPGGGHVDISYLSGELAANTDKMNFIFMHHPAGDVTQSIPSEEVGGSTVTDWQIDNIADFQNVIKAHKTRIAGVFIGHVHDNHYYASEEATGGVPFVRTSSAIQFPIGYNIYKVYSGGYIQTFYKIGSDPSISENARDRIAGGYGQSAEHWQQFWLGPSSARNFSRSYPVLPAFSPTVLKASPTSAAASVATNSKIVITFSQTMDAASVLGALSFSPSTAFSVSWDISGTVLTVTPDTDFIASTAYTLVISAAAKDANGNNLSLYNLNFTTGAGPAAFAPAVTFNEYTNDITTAITPAISGEATDSASIVTSVECRVDGGPWQSVIPVDGQFNSSNEAFVFVSNAPVSRGYHTIEARATNLAGITSSSYTSYTYILTGAGPWFTAKIDSKDVINNDFIAPAPLIKISALTASPLNTGLTKMILDGADVSAAVTVSKETETVYSISYQVPSAAPLSDGLHAITVEATDADGDVSTWEISGLSVNTGSAVSISGIPLNFPNPFDPSSGTTFSYYLTRDTDASIDIFDLSGTVIAKKQCPSGTAGGSAGYNEVAWDGRTGNGEYLGNGIYLYLIIADGRVLAKGKLTAFR